MAADLAALGLKLETKDLEKGIQVLDKAGATAQKTADKFDRASKQTVDSNAKAGKSFSGVADSIKGSAAAYLSLTAAVGTAIAIGKQAIANAEEAIQVQKRLEAVYRATGGTVGFTTQELHKMADAMAASSSFDDESIRNGMAELIKFGNIHGKVFTDALQVTADYAAFNKMEFPAAAAEMGRALADVDSAARLLRSMGVAPLTDAQKALVKQLQETGREAEAQQVILDKLNGAFGGTDAAMNSGLTGSVKALGKAWDELLESIGRTDEVTAGTNYLAEYLRGVKKVVDDGDWTDRLLMMIPGGSIAVPMLKGRFAKPPSLDTTGRDPAALAREKAAQEARELDAGLAMGESNLVWLNKQDEAAAAARKKRREDAARAEADYWDNFNKMNEAEQYREMERVADLRNKFLLDREEAEAKALAERTKAELEAAEKVEENRIKLAQEVSDQRIREFKLAEEANRREFEKTVDGIDQVFREGFAAMVNGGKGSWKSFTQSLFTTFKTTVADAIYRLFAQPFVVQIVASLAGLTGFNSSAAAGDVAGQVAGAAGSGGGFGLGAVKAGWDIFKSGISGANNAFIAGINDFGAAVADMGGFMGDIGGWIGTNSTLLANIAPFIPSVLSLLQGDVKGAVASGIGAGIGFALGGPVGGAIGSFLGSVAGGLFGSKVGKPDSWTTATIDAVTGKAGITRLESNDGGNANAYKDFTLQAAEGYAAMVKALGGTVASANGINPSLTTRGRDGKLTFEINTEKGGVGRVGAINVNPKDEAEIIKRMNAAYAGLIMRGFVDLPDYMQKVVDANRVKIKPLMSKDEIAKAAGLIELLAGVKALHDGLEILPPLFAKLKLAVDGVTSAESLAAVNAQVSALTQFYSLFYSEREKFDFSASQLAKTFAALNLAMPSSRDGYRSLVEGIDTTTQAGMDMFSALVALAPAMDGYYNALGDQRRALDDLMLSMDRYATRVDFTRAVSYAQSGVDVSSLPSYDVGTNYVPATGPALIHQGEAVIPAAENRQRGMSLQAVEEGLRRLEQKIEAGLFAVASSSSDMAKRIRKWDGDGMPATRTV